MSAHEIMGGTSLWEIIHICIIVVKALFYKPEGLRVETRGGE
jgi:hypothetical protein